MPLDDVRRHRFEFVRTPDRIAVLVDDRGANTFDEIMSGDAGQRDTVVLLEAFLNPFEFRASRRLRNVILSEVGDALRMAASAVCASSASEVRKRATMSSTLSAP